MAFYIKLYLATIPVFFAIDILWLGFIAKSFYRSQLGHILAPNVNWPWAITFYLIYIVGILLFAVIPAIDKGSIKHALVWGALFGFFTYITYDLTNLATAKDFPVKIAIVDILWGTFLCTTTASISFLIGSWLKS